MIPPFRIVNIAGALALAVSVLGGCATKSTLPSDYLSDSYTKRSKSDKDELLRGLTGLSLEQAQSIAIANNPNYVAAYYSITAAKMRYYQALGLYSPEVSAAFNVDNTYSRYYNQQPDSGMRRSNAISTKTTVGANWLLFDGLAREFSVMMSKVGYEQQQSLAEDACRLLIRSVAYAYNAILLANENKRIANEDLSFQIKNLRDTELKYQAGTVPLSEVLNFRVLANVAEGDHITAEYQYEIALYSLAVLMGYPEGTLPPEIKFPMIKDVVLADLPGADIFLDNALANRPDLRSYREQLQISEYTLYQTYSAFSPVFYAYATFGFNSSNSDNQKYAYNPNISGPGINNGNYGERSKSNVPSFSYGLNATWTIFNGLIRYNRVREAEALLASTKYQLADVWLRVVQEVRNAYINYVQNVKQTRLYEKTLEITTKQRDLVDDEYKAGNTELARLNQAQRDLVDAQTALASAYINVQNSRAQLDAAAAMNVSEYSRPPAVFADSADVRPSEFTPAEHVTKPTGQPAAKTADQPAAKPTAKPAAKPVAPGTAPAWNPDNLAI